MRSRLGALGAFAVFVVVWFLLDGIAAPLATRRFVPNLPNSFWALPTFYASEIGNLIAVVIATALAAALVRRSFTSYGLAGRGHGIPNFFAGLFFGLGAVALLAWLVSLLGGYYIAGWHETGSDLARFALLWAGAMLLVGVSEEMTFRGVPLFELTRAIGFWPAAIVLSVIFGALHYFLKPHETWADWTSVSLLGLFTCLTVLRTGALWFAIGFHAAWDYLAVPVLGSPNGGEYAQDRLLNGVFSGPDWLTGGALGLEASYLVFLVIALLFLVFTLVFRASSQLAADRIR